MRGDGIVCAYAGGVLRRQCRAQLANGTAYLSDDLNLVSSTATIAMAGSFLAIRAWR